MSTTTTFHETGIRGLRASAPQTLPFAPDIAVRAFLLERTDGDLLLFSNGLLGRVPGVERQYLTHWHEAMFGVAEGPSLVHHLAERPHVDGETFAGAFTLGDDFEAIPIPGHTPGSTAYRWDTGDQRLLFTGDSLYLRDGRWVAAVLDSSDRASYVASLERLRDVEFDVLVPWAASADGPLLDAVDAATRRARLDAILDRVRAGEDA